MIKISPSISFVPDNTFPVPTPVSRTHTSPDPAILEHEIHWRICNESYQENRQHIGQWKLVYGDIETCIYSINGVDVIIGFRGTAATKDLYDDARITMGTLYPRSQQAEEFVRHLLEMNPGIRIQLTGHSLGGAVAHEVGKRFNLFTVTFNAAAPPSHPVLNHTNEIGYHIVFDLVSAWQSPNVIRIDKGYRPQLAPWLTMIPYIWIFKIFKDVLPSHSLENFSDEKPGSVQSPCYENNLMQKWFLSLPLQARNYVLTFLLSSNGLFSTSLPNINGTG